MSILIVPVVLCLFLGEYMLTQNDYVRWCNRWHFRNLWIVLEPPHVMNSKKITSKWKAHIDSNAWSHTISFLNKKWCIWIQMPTFYEWNTQASGQECSAPQVQGRLIRGHLKYAGNVKEPRFFKFNVEYQVTRLDIVAIVTKGCYY